MEIAPVAVGAVQSYSAPSMNTRRTVTHASHREYIGTISGGGAAFTLAKYSINPGLSSSFPWSWYIANNFDFYRFSKFAVEYVPLSAASTTGVVQLAIDFDAADASPTSRSESNNYASNVSGSPWQATKLIVSPTMLASRGRLYTRMGSEPNTDIKTYDLGNLYIITEGIAIAGTPYTGVLGDLYIDYEVDYMEPQINNSSAMAKAGRVDPTAGQTLALPLGTVVDIVGNITDVISVIDNAGVSGIEFNQPWEGIVGMYTHGTNLAGEAITTAASTAAVTVVNSALEGTGYYLKNVAVNAEAGQILNVTMPAGAGQVFETFYATLAQGLAPSFI
jgi:hypothetical protein